MKQCLQLVVILQYLHGKWQYFKCIATVLSNICQRAEDTPVGSSKSDL